MRYPPDGSRNPGWGGSARGDSEKWEVLLGIRLLGTTLWCGLSNHQDATAQMLSVEPNYRKSADPPLRSAPPFSGRADPCPAASPQRSPRADSPSCPETRDRLRRPGESAAGAIKGPPPENHTLEGPARETLREESAVDKS